MNRILLNLLPMVVAVVASQAQAAGISYSYLIGSVYSFDARTVTLEDRKHGLWRFPRTVLKTGFQVVPNQRISVRVPDDQIQRLSQKKQHGNAR